MRSRSIDKSCNAAAVGTLAAKSAAAAVVPEATAATEPEAEAEAEAEVITVLPRAEGVEGTLLGGASGWSTVLRQLARGT